MLGKRWPCFIDHTLSARRHCNTEKDATGSQLMIGQRSRTMNTLRKGEMVGI
jgi:hypothetical protein